MKLPFKVKSLDEIQEPLRGAYSQVGDEFVLSVDGIPNPDELSSKLRSANAEAANRRKQLESWEKLGKTPEEIEALLVEQKRLEDEKAAKEGNFEKLKQQLLESHQKEKETLAAQANNYRSLLENFMIESSAVSAIAAEKGVPELLMPHIRSRTKVIEKDGKFGLSVVDEKGEIRYDSKGEPMTISALVSEMKQNQVFGRAFDGTQQGGSGAPPKSGNGSGGGGGNGALKRSQMSAPDRAAYIREHGQQAYLQLPK